MENQILLCNLFDYYGTLLTDKQQKYFEEYYFNNLTLAELSENYDVSRNAIHKSLKDVSDKLLEYENKLKLLEKNNEIKKIIINLDDDIKNEILKNI